MKNFGQNLIVYAFSPMCFFYMYCTVLLEGKGEISMSVLKK